MELLLYARTRLRQLIQQLSGRNVHSDFGGREGYVKRLNAGDLEGTLLSISSQEYNGHSHIKTHIKTG